MHELGVVFYVIRDVKKVAEENNVSKVNSVTLRIGEVSGILHDYLTDCWNWARKREAVVAGAELRIETIPAVTHCQTCGADYETVRYAKICPKCGSEDTYLITGNEFLIKEIEVAEEAEDWQADEYEEVEAEEDWMPDEEEIEAEEDWMP